MCGNMCLLVYWTLMSYQHLRSYQANAIKKQTNSSRLFNKAMLCLNHSDHILMYSSSNTHGWVRPVPYPYLHVSLGC